MSGEFVSMPTGVSILYLSEEHRFVSMYVTSSRRWHENTQYVASSRRWDKAHNTLQALDVETKVFSLFVCVCFRFTCLHMSSFKPNEDTIFCWRRNSPGLIHVILKDRARPRAAAGFIVLSLICISTTYLSIHPSISLSLYTYIYIYILSFLSRARNTVDILQTYCRHTTDLLWTWFRDDTYM